MCRVLVIESGNEWHGSSYYMLNLQQRLCRPSVDSAYYCHQPSSGLFTISFSSHQYLFCFYFWKKHPSLSLIKIYIFFNYETQYNFFQLYPPLLTVLYFTADNCNLFDLTVLPGVRMNMVANLVVG